MNKQDFKTKIINSIIFRSKLNKLQAEQFHKLEITDILLYYIETMPEPKTIREANNQLAWIRKYSWPLLKKKDEYSSYLTELQEKYREFINTTGANNTADFSKDEYELYQLYIDSLDHTEKVVKTFEDMILRYNTRLENLCKIFDKENLSLHDFCQLINLTTLTAKLNIRDEDHEERRHYYYLFLGVEQDRSDLEWKQNKSNNMPLFHLIHESVMIIMSQNKDMRQKMDDFFMHDLGFAKHAVIIREDEDGNKTMEKYYPKLHVLK